jgi:tetratricopeptide (TPR) repeat protein
MRTSATDKWASVRQSFADQFEQSGVNFVYRRSQEGEAIMVSPTERQNFIDEFGRSVRHAAWMLYTALALVLGGTIAFALVRDVDLSQSAIFIGIGIAVIPYLVYYRWAWAAPGRELAGRTPIAGKRSQEEIQRLRFGRITYPQLLAAAFAGLMIPFIGSAREDVFSGWNRLWLVVGAGFVLFVAVRAFQKWRFEQEDSQRNTIGPATERQVPVRTDASASTDKKWFWRYLPPALVILGLAAMLYIPVAKRLAKQPGFWPFVMVGCGGWALFTVARGLSKGQIEPFARGFYNSYEREAQPRRFWASMSWNALFGCFCLWIAFAMSREGTTPPTQKHCFDQQGAYSAEAAIATCSESIRQHPRDPDAYLDRGIVFLNKMSLDEAVADFTRAHELDPSSPWPLADRGIAYAWKNERAPAEQDFELVRKIDPANPILLHGKAILSMNAGDLDTAIEELTAALKINPRDAWALQTRSDAHQQRGDFEQARADRNRLSGLEEARK